MPGSTQAERGAEGGDLDCYGGEVVDGEGEWWLGPGWSGGEEG